MSAGCGRTRIAKQLLELADQCGATTSERNALYPVYNFIFLVLYFSVEHFIFLEHFILPFVITGLLYNHVPSLICFLDPI
jgi:hypothetical protein